MANHSYEYKGRRISIDIDAGSKGLYTWTYTIDGKGSYECNDRRLESEGVMLAEAKQNAEQAVDRMPAPAA